MRPDDPTFLTREDHRLPGVKRLLTLPNPAAGAEWSARVPGGRQWRPLIGSATFTASAAVGNRSPGFGVTVDTSLIFGVNGGASIAAGQAFPIFYVSRAGLGGITGGTGYLLGPMPDLWLPPGVVMGSNTPGILAGDQYSAIVMLIEECYADDTQLSEAHLEREQEERALAEHSQAILIGG